ncbi:MAG: S9 family peptidase, partial [Prevotellaceae bacterium]|nr:S9 family peptidase [Prevotellaceae bacterium]
MTKKGLLLSAGALIALALIVILLLTTMKAKNTQEITGDWKGTLNVQGVNMELIFHIAANDGTYSTTVDVPMQSVSGIAIDTTELVNDELTLSSVQLQFSYKGTLKDGAIEGNFEQAGMSLPLTLTKFENKLPGDVSLPSTDEELAKLIAFDKGDFKYKVEDYFARPKASAFQFSPNGKYLSYREKDENNKRHVFVKEIATGKIQRVIEEKEELVQGYNWVNDERLVYMMDRGGNENYHIYAVNIDGTNNIDLTPFEDVQAGISNLLKEQKDFIIIEMNKNNKQVFEPYKLNVVTGEMVQLFENKDIANPIQGYDFDKDGELRAYSKLVNGVEAELWYKDLTTGEFKLIYHGTWYEGFGILGFDYAGANPDYAYVATNVGSDKMRIVLYDFKNNKIVKEVFSNPDYDVSSMSRSRKRNYEIDYFSYEGEKNVIVPVSAFYTDLHNRMEKEFKGKESYVVDYDDDENTFLLVVQSDKLYGTYYQYDVKTKKFALLYDLMPQLKEEDMAEMRPI